MFNEIYGEMNTIYNAHNFIFVFRWDFLPKINELSSFAHLLEQKMENMELDDSLLENFTFCIFIYIFFNIILEYNQNINKK